MFVQVNRKGPDYLESKIAGKKRSTFLITNQNRGKKCKFS